MKKIICLLCLFFAGSVSALPITYNYSGAWSSYSSGDFGANYSVDVVFDNGGSDVANQTWDASDFLSVSVSSGSYSNSWLATDITAWNVDFFSDASGQLNSGWVNLSNLGGNFHFDPNWPDANVSSTSGSAGYFSNNVSSVGTLTSVPEPAVLSLLALGLVGIGFTRKKKSA